MRPTREKGERVLVDRGTKSMRAIPMCPSAIPAPPPTSPPPTVDTGPRSFCGRCRLWAALTLGEQPTPLLRSLSDTVRVGGPPLSPPSPPLSLFLPPSFPLPLSSPRSTAACGRQGKYETCIAMGSNGTCTLNRTCGTMLPWGVEVGHVPGGHRLHVSRCGPFLPRPIPRARWMAGVATSWWGPVRSHSINGICS